MSRTAQRLPVEIDPFRLAERGAELAGSLPLGQMQRLGTVLFRTDGRVNIRLQFGIDDLNIPYVRGQIDTVLYLTCQRCLGELEYPVSQSLALAWVRADRDAERLPLQFEPYIVAQTPVRLSDVIEDELLLSLPQIPMHAESQCEATAVIESLHEQHAEPEQDNPFAELEKLKQDK